MNNLHNIKLTGLSSKILLTFYNDILNYNNLVEKQFQNYNIKFIEKIDKPSL